MAMVRNFEVMLGQTLNYYVEFCNFVQFHSKLFNLLLLNLIKLFQSAP
jgi:hypothetical protein